jgi:uncharacterized SAM-binding protein YcdF (DUF218 family)
LLPKPIEGAKPNEDVTIFVLAKIFWYLAAPGNFLLLLLLVGTFAFALRGRRFGAALIGLAAVGFLAVAVTPLPEWSLLPLENRFPQPALPAHIDGIILLGGAVDPGIGKARGQPAVNEAGERVIATAALSRRFPDVRILLSGGEGLRKTGGSEAAATRQILLSLGVAPERIILEERSRDTIENAEYGKALIQPQSDQVWVLVTSAAHMPRAVGCFRHVGWNVVPYPVDYRTAPGIVAPDYYLSERLALIEFAAKEWVGLGAYRLLGRIDDLFPGPR